MKAFIILILLFVISIICLEVFTGTTKLEEEIKTPSLQMELYCVTPHGHPVYRYRKGHESVTVYVLLRAGDGYPIAITK